jgi:hypothetical protein
VTARKFEYSQSVTDKLAGDAVGTEAANVMFVKSPFGLHPIGLGLRPLSQVGIRGRRPNSRDDAARFSLCVRDRT